MLWILFILSILSMLAVDFGVFFKSKEAVQEKRAPLMTFFWIVLALLFNYFVYLFRGPEEAMQFLTGYIVEKMLSIDNLFLFIMIFSYFKVPRKYQYKVLFLGIIGAVTMRLLFIGIGALLLKELSWMIYVFGAFLLWIGLQFLRKQKNYSMENSKVFLWVQKYLPVTKEYHDGRFFIRRGKALVATPLFLAIIMIEFTDFVAALDSIPAIFVITTDMFIVFTSNMFAVLGLRSLYFVIAGALQKLRFLYIGLSAILFYLGAKILVSPWIEIPLALSLGVVIAAVGTTILFSLKLKE